MEQEPSLVAYFGPFTLDLRRRVLTRDGVIVRLAPKDVEILFILIQSSGQLVEKKDLIERVWPQTFVEEANLSRHVFNLRKALWEDGGSQLIETLPKRGYRFVAPVEFKPEPATNSKEATVLDPAFAVVGTPEGLPAQSAIGAEPSSRARVLFHWHIWVAILAVLVLGASFGVLRSTSAHLSSGFPYVTVAVLPVRNLTGDTLKDYISEGLTEELIAQLVEVNPLKLRVIGPISLGGDKSTDRVIDTISHQSGADYVLQTSLRASGERFRATTRLIRLADQREFSAHEYDWKAGDAIAMEEDCVRSVAKWVLADVSSAPRKN
jgi:DNA-binding winged helix-turn-helix (wHTH) protein/TolB-like protein